MHFLHKVHRENMVSYINQVSAMFTIVIEKIYYPHINLSDRMFYKKKEQKQKGSLDMCDIFEMRIFGILN